MGKKKGGKRPASYYIDYENVRGAGLDGVQNLRKGDRVVVLYGSKDSSLKLEQVQNILNSPAKVEFIKVATGKHDALDFQLVALMFLSMKKKRDYYIISKDTGFDFAIRMAKSRGMDHVYRRDNIAGEKQEPKALPQPKQARSAKRLPNPKRARALQAQSKDQPQQAPAGQQPQADAANRADQGKPGGPQPQQADPAQGPAGGQQPSATPPQGTQAPSQKPSRRRRRKPGNGNPKPPKDPYRLDVERVLAKHLGGLPNAKRVEIVLAALEAADTKARFYNFLRGKMGNEQGRAFYNELKGCFDDLRAIERPAPQPEPKPELEASTDTATE